MISPINVVDVPALHFTAASARATAAAVSMAFPSQIGHATNA
jgi:hypothetical protein